MAKNPEPKSWVEKCAERVELEVPDAVRATLTEHLKGVMQERSLKLGELTKLATALLEPRKEAEAEENAA